jgi:SAM-dependent methyltransferase
VELTEGPAPLWPGRALDLGCGTERNTLYLARHDWDAVGIDMLGRAIDTGRSRAVGAAASATFIHGDVTRLSDLGIGDGYNLIVDSGCYYGLSGHQREAYAAGAVTRVAAKEARLLMAGFTGIPIVGAGIGEDDLRRRFDGWHVDTNVQVSADEIMRHTRIPFPLKAGLRSGRLEIRRFELARIN